MTKTKIIFLLLKPDSYLLTVEELSSGNIYRGMTTNRGFLVLTGYGQPPSIYRFILTKRYVSPEFLREDSSGVLKRPDE